MESLLNWTNAIMCLGGVVACLCRLGNMENPKTPILLHYVMWLVILLASGSSPLWLHVPANEIQIILGAGVIGQLALGFKAWRKGAPSYTRETSTSA